MSAAGILIRRLRLERNYSQAGLCRGICAPSYLSKIEQGQAEPSPEVLDRLFAALGVAYCRDQALLEQARQQLGAYFEAREQGEVADTSWLDAHLEQLTYSDLNVTCQLYGLYRQLDRGEKPDCGCLTPLLPQMDPSQQYLYWNAKAEASAGAPEALEALRCAERQKPCAYVRYLIACALYHLGQYSQSIEAADSAYRMAADEGDLYVLVNASFLLGCCYTDRVLDLAERYYNRAIRLGSRQWPQIADWAAYNLGASYLEWGQPEKALYWLTRTRLREGQDIHNLLLYQKRSILYSQLGRREEALEALTRAEAILQEAQTSDWEQALYGDMLSFAHLLLEEGQASPDYEALLLRLYTDAGERLGFGFRRFYGLYLSRLYQSQRRYKDALRVSEEISAKDFPEKSF